MKLELQELIKRCIRILHISKKPEGEEYRKIARVTGIGMILLGSIGVIISFVLGEVSKIRLY